MLGCPVAGDVGQGLPWRTCEKSIFANAQVSIIDMQNYDTTAGLVGEALRCPIGCSRAREVPCSQLDVPIHAVGGDHEIISRSVELGPQDLRVEMPTAPDLRADRGEGCMRRY